MFHEFAASIYCGMPIAVPVMPPDCRVGILSDADGRIIPTGKARSNRNRVAVHRDHRYERRTGRAGVVRGSGRQAILTHRHVRLYHTIRRSGIGPDQHVAVKDGHIRNRAARVCCLSRQRNRRRRIEAGSVGRSGQVQPDPGYNNSCGMIMLS